MISHDYKTIVPETGSIDICFSLQSCMGKLIQKWIILKRTQPTRAARSFEDLLLKLINQCQAVTVRN